MAVWKENELADLKVLNSDFLLVEKMVFLQVVQMESCLVLLKVVYWDNSKEFR